MDAISLISMVKPGETINVNTSEIVVHHSYYASFSRWWNGEDSNKLVMWVYQKVIPEINIILNNSQRSKLISALCGIRNLAVTYVGRDAGTHFTTIAKIIEQRLHNMPNFAIPTLKLNKGELVFVYNY